jgi:hypothetical protein
MNGKGSLFWRIARSRADTGAGKTEVIIPVRAVDGGPHHRMIKKIDLHRFYVYPSSFLSSCGPANRTWPIRLLSTPDCWHPIL